MRTRTQRNQKVRNMIEQGYTTKDIVAKLKVKPQVVYNVRYQINKAKGLGSLNANTSRAGKPQGTGIKEVVRAPRAQQIITTTHGDAYVMPVQMYEPLPVWRRVLNFLMGIR